MNERWEQFSRIWKKGKTNKTVQSLMQKVSIRGLEPNEENCRDYYMGYIRYYVDAITGQGEHLNPRKNKVKMKALKRNKNAKEQGGYRKGKPSHKVGRRYPQKKRKIQRR
jgi:hypothetical protein